MAASPRRTPRHQGPRFSPKLPRVDPVLRKRILYAYGTSQRALMDGPLDARALAAACGLELRRAKACLRGCGSPWAPHVEARRIVECGDRVLAGRVPGPGELVQAVPAVDFKALVLALGARGYTWTQIGRRLGMGVYTLSHWASGRRSPSWLGGELLLHAWHSASTPGEWPPAAPPAAQAPDPGAVPAPV